MHKVQDMQHKTRPLLAHPLGMLLQVLLHRNIFGAAKQVPHIFCCTAKTSCGSLFMAAGAGRDDVGPVQDQES
ncbi:MULTISPECIES: hypothetical protein [unclassified Mesorhizobium]|uniref:hypothetical protein n=1 Tax=unclassified Mesorhizobium TaxID=325217 RepID=UPI0015E3E9BB|nr:MULTISPECIES: hypothetical protein [unclassified Mesorhizobium]